MLIQGTLLRFINSATVKLKEKKCFSSISSSSLNNIFVACILYLPCAILSQLPKEILKNKLVVKKIYMFWST